MQLVTKYPAIGEIRQRTIFCWFPKSFYDKTTRIKTTYWLETITLVEHYVPIKVPYKFPGYSVRSDWKTLSIIS